MVGFCDVIRGQVYTLELVIGINNGSLVLSESENLFSPQVLLHFNKCHALFTGILLVYKSHGNLKVKTVMALR